MNMARAAIGLALAFAALAAYGAVFYRTAWLCDDAYITYRVVDNIVHGHGPRWNVNERVQAYTHPLWMALHAAVHAVVREPNMYFTGIAIAGVVSVLAAGALLFGIARTWLLGALAVAAMVFSRAYMDYSSSGLENPMTHLLLGLFLLLYFKEPWSTRRAFFLGFIAALAFLNRMDSILLFAPALGLVLWRHRAWPAPGAVVAGMLPVAAWLLFALVYYGFPFPNTAYAKLGAGSDQAELYAQGLRYLEHTLAHDALTLVVIGAGAIAALATRRAAPIALALGMGLYLLYIVRIGGDFMAGRYLTAPFFVALAILARHARLPDRPAWAPPAAAAVVVALMAGIGLAQPHAPLLTGADFGEERAAFSGAHGVADERRFYFQHTGLIARRPERPHPDHPFAAEGRAYREQAPHARAIAHGSVGFRGFFAGPDVHIVDLFALSDPLLARLPARYRPDWRIGHFGRAAPDGYLDSAIDGEARMDDERLNLYYAELVRITRGPLFAVDRWRAIAAMNLGGYDALIDQDYYRYFNIARPNIVRDETTPPDTIVPRAAGPLRFAMAGIEIPLGGVSRADTVRISLTPGNRRHHLLFYHGGKRTGRLEVHAPETRGRPAIFVVDAPEGARAGGYDLLRIVPYRHRTPNELRHLSLNLPPEAAQ